MQSGGTTTTRLGPWRQGWGQEPPAQRCLRFGHSARLIVVGLVLTAGMLMLLASPAAASRARVTLVSLPDPLPAFGSPGACESAQEATEEKTAKEAKEKRRDWEWETSLAVNPTNRRNLVTAWIQDHNNAIGVGVSTNGGTSWQNVVPTTTICTGGPAPSGATETGISDPWLSFGPSLGAADPQGIAYLASLPQYSPTQETAEIINTSHDGGRTWSTPVVVDTAKPPLAIDADYVIADPDWARLGYAYASWQRRNLVAGTSTQYVSHTTNGGESWSVPKELPSGTGPFQLIGRLLALPGGPKGTLVDIIGETPSQPGAATQEFIGPTKLVARRSTDLGEHWTEPPTIIAEADSARLATSSVALAPDRRTIYVSWWHWMTSSTFSLMYSKSTDLGVTWSLEKAIGAPVVGPLFVKKQVVALPSLAVAPDGTLGVAFYDQRNWQDKKEGAPVVTDFWLRVSHDEGKTWEKDSCLAGPFDLGSAPKGAAPEEAAGFIGDYWGIAPIAGGFADTFTLASPVEGADANFTLASPPTDIFFDKVRTHGHYTCGTHRRHRR
jgi:hypothetical protein